MLFSQRNGYKASQKPIQRESVDTDLRNGLQTALHLHLWPQLHTFIEDNLKDSSVKAGEILTELWIFYLKRPLYDLTYFSGDKIYPHHVISVFIEVDSVLKSGKWFEVYDVLEFIYQRCPPYLSQNLWQALNAVLTQENSAYRLVGGRFVESSSEAELESISEAIETSSELGGVRIHLDQALSLISNRQNPDYRNSIKESISAVEALAKIITKDSKATLGKALKVLESSEGIHPALKQSLSSLYGYTSDADGIRHALMQESKLTFTDAKFIFVSCTAFINYLIAKATEQGIDLAPLEK